MYCKHCGAKIDDNSEFCKFCGGAQSDNASADFGNGHAYHTPDPFEINEPDEPISNNMDSNIDPFSDVETHPNHSIDPFSDTPTRIRSIDEPFECTNPFDREIQEDLRDITDDKEVQESMSSGYIKTKNGVKQPTLPPQPSNAGAYMKSMHHHTDKLSDHDRTLAILTLVMAFIFPIAGIILGKKFFYNISSLEHPDPYYVKIAKVGLNLSYVDTGLLGLGIILAMILPFLLVLA